MQPLFRALAGHPSKSQAKSLLSWSLPSTGGAAGSDDGSVAKLLEYVG